MDSKPYFRTTCRKSAGSLREDTSFLGYVSLGYVSLCLMGVMSCQKNVPSPKPTYPSETKTGTPPQRETTLPSQNSLSGHLKLVLQPQNAPNLYWVDASWIPTGELAAQDHQQEIKLALNRLSAHNQFEHKGTFTIHGSKVTPALRDKRVTAGESYEYCVTPSDAQGGLPLACQNITIPRDLDLRTRQVRLLTHTRIKTHRLFLGPRPLITQGYGLTIEADKIVSHKAYIAVGGTDVNEGTPPPSQEKQGSQALRNLRPQPIVIMANEASGVLFISGDGAAGPDGRPGKEGKPGMIGPKGSAGQAKDPHDTYWCRCVADPTNGGPGQDGNNGEPGTDGEDGGDAAGVFVRVMRPRGLTLRVSSQPGVGGRGGAGGGGGAGGPGGPPGDNPYPSICTPASPGRPGTQGTPGQNGRNGKWGNPASRCLWIGSQKQGECDVPWPHQNDPVQLTPTAARTESDSAHDPS